MPMTMHERLGHARCALESYLEAKGEHVPTCDKEYEDTDASDLIADLLHLQTHLSLRDAQRTIATALMHFEAEQEEAEEKSQEIIVSSTHGVLTSGPDGYILETDLQNREPDGGGHLARITRFDFREWSDYWGTGPAGHIDILDLGYWYCDPATGDSYAPPDAKWRKDIAQEMFGRVPVPAAKPNVIAIRVEGGLVQDVTGLPDGYELHAEDHDAVDDMHTSCNTEKNCSVTVYPPARPSKYRVKVSVRTVETWEIHARDESEARELWEEGILLATDGYEMDKILSIENLTDG